MNSEAKRFYKHVAKTGWYSPMKRCNDDVFQRLRIDGVSYKRDQCDTFKYGLPLHSSLVASRNPSHVERFWINLCKDREQEGLFQFHIRGLKIERFKAARNETMRRNRSQGEDMIDAFRKARRKFLTPVYAKYFVGCGFDNVPMPVLFLALSHMKLKEVIKYQNRT